MDELEVAIRERCPIIYVQTSEEDRAIQYIDKVAKGYKTK